MISEEQVRATLARYVELVGAGDMDGILALYAEDARVEEPVGKPAHVGIEAISRFYREGLGRLDATARLDGAIRATRGCGAVPFCVDLDWAGQARTIEVIDVMEFDADGRIRCMKAYWGEANMVARGQP